MVRGETKESTLITMKITKYVTQNQDQAELVTRVKETLKVVVEYQNLKCYLTKLQEIMKESQSNHNTKKSTERFILKKKLKK